MLMVLFEMDDVACPSRCCYSRQSSGGAVETDEKGTWGFGDQHVASSESDVAVEQQLSSDRKTWLQQHPMAW